MNILLQTLHTSFQQETQNTDRELSNDTIMSS